MKCFESDQVIYEFSYGMDAIAHIEDGEEFSVKTNDCFFQQIKTNDDLISEIDFAHVNPATGPFYINGAEPGDILKVDILDIKIADEGVIVVLPGAGVLGDQASKALTRVIPIEDNQVNFLGVKENIDPMIGVIGVSPGKDQEGVVTGTPGNHGGNMDTTDIRANTSLYFPVREEGAMLALGDFHAIMGDGELCVAGLEVEAEAKLRVSVIKDKEIEWPVLESTDEFMVIASGETIEKASYNAGSQITKFIQDKFEFEWEEAYMFNSMFVDYKISQLVNPMKTARAVVKKKHLSMADVLKTL